MYEYQCSFWAQPQKGQKHKGICSWTRRSWYLFGIVSLVTVRSIIGIGGNILSVSLMQHSKYFISVRSCELHGRSESPKIEFNSSLTSS